MIEMQTTIEQEINQANTPTEVKQEVVTGTHELQFKALSYGYICKVQVDVIENKEDGSNGWDIGDCGFSLLYKLDGKEVIKMTYSDEIGEHLKTMEVLDKQLLSDLLQALSYKTGLFDC